MKRHSWLAVILPAFAVAGLLPGCGEEAVQKYTAPKDPTLARAALVDPDDHADHPGGQVMLLSWTLPPGWSEVESPPTGPGGIKRYATLRSEAAPDADVSVTYMPNQAQAGDILLNVNRWRRQIGLPDITAPMLKDQVMQNEMPGTGEIRTAVALEGPEKSTLGVIIPRPEVVWFMKMTGPKDAVAGQRMAFGELVRSLHFVPRDEPVAEEPGGTGQSGAMQRALAEKDILDFKAAGDWSQDATPAPMSQLSFRAPVGKDVVVVTVTPLEGQAGGLIANLNRWRQQVGLPPVQEIKDQPMEMLNAGNRPALLFDLGSAPGEKRIIAAVIPQLADKQAVRTWFVKLTGPPAAVGAQRNTFIDFVKSLVIGDRNHPRAAPSALPSTEPAISG